METGATSHIATPAVNVVNRSGAGNIVLVCDHASNRMPAPYDRLLGVSEADKRAHVAWDPGALGVSMELSRLLDAPLVASTISRLIIDCNRDETAPDLIPAVSETTVVPGNGNLTPEDRQLRIDLAHRPFHSALDGLLSERLDRNQPTAVVSVHSFTANYKGVSRPWEIGLISGNDRRMIDPVIEELRATTDYLVGDNEPYSPKDGVYYTLQRHGDDRNLPTLMIEIRNDEIATEPAELKWANLLAPILENVTSKVHGRTNA